MAHDATKVLLGTTTSSKKIVTSEPADPAVFKAGLAVRRGTDGGLQLENDDVAGLIGVSLGVDKTDCKKTSVARNGLGIPLQIVTAYATGTATIGSYADMTDGGNDSFTVGDVEFVAQTGAVEEGDATFQAAVSEEATAASLADQINTNDDTKDVVTAVADGADVVITAKDLGDAGNSIVLTFTDDTENTAGSVTGSGTLEDGIDSPATKGGQVSVNDAGKGCDDGDEDASATGGTYATEVMTGVDVDGAECFVALIDVRGSL